MSFKTSNLEELIGALRVQIGDIDPSPAYSDEYLHRILGYAVNALMNRWSKKYYLDNDGVVHRNLSNIFDFSSPPVIQRQDERAIVLQSSIMIKSGTKFSDSGDAVSWRDDEIRFSNIEAARQKSSALADDIAELNAMLPTNKLARPVYGRSYGWTKDW